MAQEIPCIWKQIRKSESNEFLLDVDLKKYWTDSERKVEEEKEKLGYF